MRIVLNPSPVEGIAGSVPLDKVDYLFVNEKEICQISGQDTPAASIAALHNVYPDMTVIYTRGSRGAEIHGKDHDSP